MATTVQIIFYSMYGHIYRMAEAVAEGVRQVEAATAELYQVPELVPDAALQRTGAARARAVFAHVPMAHVDKLPGADAIIVGTPTRFGNLSAQMRNFFDQTGGLWVKGALEGKVGSVFTSTGTQHGGQETTIASVHWTLLHHGMIIVGVANSESGLSNMKEITGGSPYGASTLASSDGSRLPTDNELQIARSQGRRVAEIAKRLKGEG